MAVFEKEITDIYTLRWLVLKIKAEQQEMQKKLSEFFCLEEITKDDIYATLKACDETKKKIERVLEMVNSQNSVENFRAENFRGAAHLQNN